MIAATHTPLSFWLTERMLLWSVVVASIAYSAIKLLFDPLINPDAVLYLLVAQAWLDGGLAAASAFETRPFYSLLIAAIHSGTGLTLLASAHVLNAALIALLAVALLRLASILGVSTRAQLLVAALTLLLPSLNEFRSFLIRDFGYWAFCVFAIGWLVRYARLEKPRYAVAFFASALAAALFRMEAVLYLSALPLALLLRRKPRIMPVAKLYLPHVLFGGLIAILLAIGGSAARLGNALVENLMGRPLELLQAVVAESQSRVAAFGTYVVDGSVSDFAAAGAVGGILTMVLVHMVNACSIPLFAFALVGTWRRSYGFVDRPALRVLGATIVLVVAGMFVLAMAIGVVQSRYAELVALVVTILAAFTMNELAFGEGSARARRTARILVGLTFAYLLGEAGFALKHSKAYYQETVAWIQQHTAQDAWVYSNDARIPYLSGRKFQWQDVNPQAELPLQSLRNGIYDYWVIHLRRSDRELAGALQSELERAPRPRELTRIVNAKGDAFVILQPAS